MAKNDSFEAAAAGVMPLYPGGVIALVEPVAEGMVALQAAHSAGLALLANQQSQQQAAIVSGAAACMTCSTLLASAPASRDAAAPPVDGPAARAPADPAVPAGAVGAAETAEPDRMVSTAGAAKAGAGRSCPKPSPWQSRMRGSPCATRRWSPTRPPAPPSRASSPPATPATSTAPRGRARW